MPTVYVKPRAGGRVRMPDRDFRPMPDAGAHVPRIDFYERLIITGDLEITDPPPAEEAPSAAPEPAPPEPEPETEATPAAVTPPRAE